MKTNNLPNFLYIGPDKAGSTWLFEVLNWHPEVYVPEAKDLYFFSHYYDRGMRWYKSHFEDKSDEQVAGEICHDYLFSQKAAERISRDLPEVKLLINLREPVSRTISDFLNRKKLGLIDCSFQRALEEYPDIKNRSFYSKYVSYYLDLFSKDQIKISIFDDLKYNSDEFAKDIFHFLDVQPLSLPEDLKSKSNPASQARFKVLNKIIKYGALIARELGLETLVGRLKTNRCFEKLLFKKLDGKRKPDLPEDVLRELKCSYHGDIKSLQKIVDCDLSKKWGYEK